MMLQFSDAFFFSVESKKLLCFYEKRLWNLEDVSEEVDVCTGRSGHDGHGERGIDILQMAPHWRLTDYQNHM